MPPLTRLEPLAGGGLDRLERRQGLEQRVHRQLVGVVHLAQAELGVVRVQQPVAADLVLQRQRLGLELDAVLAGDLRSHVDRGRGLLVRVAVLEDDLRVAGRKAVDVGDAAAQDERVVVEAEVRRVEEEDLAHLGPLAGLGVGDEADAGARRGALHQRAELPEAVDRGEAVRLQDQLGLEVGDLVERRAVGVAFGIRRRCRPGSPPPRLPGRPSPWGSSCLASSLSTCRTWSWLHSSRDSLRCARRRAAAVSLSAAATQPPPIAL